MDSMRSLNTSLPHSSSRRAGAAQPSGELLQAFKAAALSVTQLYKTAASGEDTARTAGYQDAIDELLAFLDAENLGLGDGEGWRVRQWATERLSPASYGSDAEDNMMDNDVSSATTGDTNSNNSTTKISGNTQTSTTTATTKNSTASTSPEPQTKTSVESTSSSLPLSPPPQDQIQPQTSSSAFPSSNAFHFRSSMTLPTSSIIADSEMENGDPPNDSTLTSNPNTNTPVVKLVPRTSKQISSYRDRQHASRLAGAKRKPNFNDFFDFDNLGRDGSPGAGGNGGGGAGGGGKKVRFA